MRTTVFKVVFSFLLLQSAHSQTVPDSTMFPKVSFFTLLEARRQVNSNIDLKNKPLSLLVFLSPECPLSQNYTKVLNQLQDQFKDQVGVYGIIPGNAYTTEDVIAFEDKYQVNFKLFIDTELKLTHYLHAAVTPQVVLLSNNSRLLYTGAIDDWVISLGKKRLQASRFYIQDAIEQSLQFGIVQIKKTDAIGCKINDY